MTLPSCRVLAFCLAAALALPALADTRRVAVVVGNNVGGPSDQPLRYAEEDTAKVADVLAQLGEVRHEDLFVLRGQKRADLERLLTDAGKRIADYRREASNRTVLIFYYSGHSDAEALELGGSRVLYSDLRAWLARTRADVRVAIVDGCRSGSLMQTKGGRKAAAFEIKLSDQLDATGEVMLTSAAADELALESKEVHGSLFTHHFVSGLRGAADASGDGRVTLAEAYQYAFDHTLAASASAGVHQHPAYEYKLTGQGDLVLTEVSANSASLELPSGFDRALVLLVRRDQVLAELGAGGSGRVALAPGEYAVRLWKGSQAYVARASVGAGEAKRLAWTELQSVPSEPVAWKGESDLAPGAKAEYLAKFIVVDAAGRGHQGTSLTPLTPLQLLDMTGHVAEAATYRRRRIVGWSLLAGGAAVGLGGTVWHSTRSTTKITLSGQVVNNRSKSDDSIYYGCLGVGVAMSLVSVIVMPYGLPRDELQRIAKEYNENLERQLTSPPPQTSDAPRLRVLPTVTPEGGGLALQGTF